MFAPTACVQDEYMEVACAHMLAFPNASLPAMDIAFTLEQGSAQSAGLYIRCCLAQSASLEQA